MALGRFGGLAVFAALGAAAFGQGFAPFVIPTKQNPKSLIAFAPGEAIRPDSARVVARGGHFYLGQQRCRVWGVNLCFGANFPTHKDAETVAARLAAFGVNSVRLHHMDMFAFPGGIWDPKDPTKLSAVALDRLDYFLDRLARRGITVNVNLHVSRTHSRFLKLPDPGTGYDKIVDTFTPALIDAQKKYARELLTHVNTYRKVRYADDPAVAFVEITNEDSLFMWGAEQRLPNLPPYYAKVLQQRLVDWLKNRYGTGEKLRVAWAKGASPLGENVLAGASFEPAPAAAPDRPRWRLEQHAECKAKLIARGPAHGRIEIARADKTGWHVQVNCSPVAVKAGRYYTVGVRARADRPRRITCNVSQAHEPWKWLGGYREMALTKGWQTFRFGFVAEADDGNARVNFAVGASTIAVELADVAFRPGGRVGLRKEESLADGSVAVFADSESAPRAMDRMRFLAETEKAYFDGMRDFIRNDLGCKALVTGTIVFGPLGLWAQSGMDYVDAHAYWQHPRFPGRPWDPANWTVEQKAMADQPDGSPLLQLAASRLAGKPFTVSEYNHPAPNDYQAECVPMIASFAAAQDWDGVWLFAYSHRTDDWDARRIRGFFDIDHNPAKWGLVPAGAAIFREAAIPPLWKGDVISLADAAEALADLARLHLAGGRNLLARVEKAKPMDRGARLNRRLAVSPSGRTRPLPDVGNEPPCPVLSWSRDETGRGFFEAAGPGAWVCVGHARNFARMTAGMGVSVSGVAFAAVAQTALDGLPRSRSRKILVTVCGRCENTGMKFSKDRRTVGRDWGDAPVRIEAARVVLPIPAGRWRCRALGPDGLPTADVPVRREAGAAPFVELLPKYKTLWYLLTRKGP